MMVTNCFSGMVALRTARSCIFRRDIAEEAHYSGHGKVGINPGSLKQPSIVLPIILRSHFSNHFYFLS